MRTAVAISQWAEAVAFAGLGLLTLVDWLRHRDRQRASLAWAIGLLALVTLMGRIQAATGTTQLRVLNDIIAPVFLLSGYALLLFRHSFIPLRRETLQAVLGLVIVVTLIIDLIPPQTDISKVSTLEWVALIGYLLIWCACVMEPVVRFWRASRRRPTIQRARLRALSLGYGGIVLVLLVAVGVGIGVGPASAQSDVYQLTVELVVLAVIPFLYCSFAPPRFLRRYWRDREEMAFRKATSDLLHEEDPEPLAAGALAWALRLTGADAGLIAAPGRRLLASSNLKADAVSRLLAETPGASARLVDVAAPGEPGLLAVIAPLRTPTLDGVLAVIAGPFTPLFGTGELDRLDEYGSSIGAALERVELVRALAGETERYENLLAAVSDLGDGLVVTRGGEVEYMNDAFCSITGVSPIASDTERVGAVIARPDRAHGNGARQPVHGAPDHFEAALTRDGASVDVEISRRTRGADVEARTTAIVRDVTERRRAQDELARRAVALERSNASLEEFAYVTSHDLQEPLRMVASYLQLLQTRYRDRLDADADQFIDFAVDGARRMKNLINDLLDYSRVDTAGAPMRPTNLTDIIQVVLVDLHALIKENGARVVAHGNLPTVSGDAGQLTQLLQNLITNGIKFHGDAAPEISIEAVRSAGSWKVTVRDNGIGIDPRHTERIFMIFKRLHPIDLYPGTGIGLSICRKIVERHGGRIWVESVPGQGSAFHFTLEDAVVAPATELRGRAPATSASR